MPDTHPFCCILPEICCFHVVSLYDPASGEGRGSKVGGPVLVGCWRAVLTQPGLLAPSTLPTFAVLAGEGAGLPA